MTRVLLLGATGRTGQHLLEQALDQDYHVTALCRDVAKITLKHDQLTVAKCDIFDKELLLPHVQSADVVMSTLGFTLREKPHVTGYLRICKVLVECLKECDMMSKRVIIMHSWYTDRESRNTAEQFLTRTIFLPYVIPNVLDGMREAEKYFEEEKELVQFTFVAPPGIMNGPVTDLPISHSDEQFHLHGSNTWIHRADVARYMLTVIRDETSYRKLRAIGAPLPEPSGYSCTIM